MTTGTLISAAAMATLLERGDVLIVDCRFDLADADKGQADYQAEHIPGAVYAHLDRDLSDLNKRGQGRHPLPDDDAFSAALTRWGWHSDIDVIVYDDANGALAAARLWWLLRLARYSRVAVLDGGLAAWRAADMRLDSTVVNVPTHLVHATFNRSQVVSCAELEACRRDRDCVLIDARAAARYRGEVEPIDVVAGHVPGAVNRPFSENLDDDGRFKSSTQLHDEFRKLLGSHAPAAAIHMCGSGVTACHNLLAMEHAGLHGSRIFAPSWSGWISDPSRAVATGGESV